MQLESWQAKRPDAKFYFRPHGSATDCSTISGDDDIPDEPAEAVPGVYRGSGGCDLDESLQTDCQPGHSLLFVHQEAWQQELLEKFGNYTFRDATYRTTMYDVALFFLVVPTNVSYTVAAEFCLQSEGATEIAEALKVSCSSKTKSLLPGNSRGLEPAMTAPSQNKSQGC